MRIAPLVPAAMTRAQRRHALLVGAALGLGTARISELLNALPDSQLVPTLVEEPVEAYEAPAPPEVVTIVADAARPPTSEPSARTASLPVDVLAWAIDGAARRMEPGEVRSAIALFQQAPIAALQDWRMIKAIHRALLESALPSQERSEHYQQVVGTLSRLPTTDIPISSRAWLVHLLASAATQAWASSALSQAHAWRALARAHAAELPPPEGISANILRRETTYRLAELDTRMARRLDEIAEAHRRVLDSIPEVDTWGNRRWLWATRALRHLKPALRSEPSKPRYLQLLDAALVAMPLSLDKVQQYKRYLADQTELDASILQRLREAMRRDLSDTSFVGPAGMALHRCLQIMTKRAGELPIPDWGAAAVGNLQRHWDPEQAGLYILCLDYASREQQRLLAISCRELIDYLQRSQFDETEDLLRVLRARCIKHLATHQLSEYSVRPSDNDETGRRNSLLRLNNIERRIDGLFKANLASDPEGWLAADWAEWKLVIVRRRNGLLRNMTDTVTADTGSSLKAFVNTLDSELGTCAPVDLAAMQVARYLWNVDELRVRTRRLVQSSLPSHNRARVIRVVQEAWSSFVLIPKSLSLPSVLPTEADMALLVQVLSEFATLGGSENVRAAISFTAGLLESRCDETSWALFADAAERLLGRPEDFWSRLSWLAQHQEDAPPPVGLAASSVDEMTDGPSLSLIGQLLRFGCDQQELPRPLRARLGDVCVVAMAGAMSWQRSRSSSDAKDIGHRLRRGTAIVLALVASEDGRVLGRLDSPVVDRRGRPIAWRDLAIQDLDTVRGLSFGSFRQMTDHTYWRARDVLGIAPPKRDRADQ
jgi:hypothetical protein